MKDTTRRCSLRANCDAISSGRIGRTLRSKWKGDADWFVRAAERTRMYAGVKNEQRKILGGKSDNTKMSG